MNADSTPEAPLLLCIGESEGRSLPAVYPSRMGQHFLSETPRVTRATAGGAAERTVIHEPRQILQS